MRGGVVCTGHRHHDLSTLRYLWRADTGLGQDVRQPEPALVSDNSGHHRYVHGTCTVCAVQVRSQDSGHERERSKQGLNLDGVLCIRT